MGGWFQWSKAMPVPASRQSRGLPLPSAWQWLMIGAVCCAGYLYWTNRSQPSDSAEEPHAPEFVSRLQYVEELVNRGPEAVPELVAMLSNSDHVIRRFALVGLGRLGDQATESLDQVRERLSDDEAEVRFHALTAIVEISRDPDELAAVIIPLLENPDNRLRELAAKILDGSFFLNLGPVPLSDGGTPASENRRMLPNVVPRVLALAGHHDPVLRGLVVRILKQRDVSRDDPAVTETLRGLLDDSDPDVRSAAIIAFAGRGVASADEVRAWLCDKDPNVVGAALGAVEWLGEFRVLVLPELISLVGDAPPKPLWNSMDRLNFISRLISALRSLKLAAKPAVPALLQRLVELESSGFTFFGSAVPALLEMGAEPADLLPLVRPHLRTQLFGAQAAKLLARLDPEKARREAVQIIHDLEQNEDSVTEDALNLLGGLGTEARGAVPLLVRLIERNNRESDARQGGNRYNSVRALGNIGPDAAPAVTCLIALLRLPRNDLLAANRDDNVAVTLGKIGPASRSSVPLLLEILDISAPPPQRRHERWHAGAGPPDRSYLPPYEEVLRALGEIGDNSDEVLSRIRHHLEAIDSKNRSAALESLVMLDSGSTALIADLVRALGDDNVHVRLLAAGASQWRADVPRAVEALTKALSDSSPWVASAAALSLRELGREAASAIPALREMSQQSRNAVPNGIRSPGHYSYGGQSRLDADDFAHLSAAQAARRALEAIDVAP
jgi:HEAT repeat protein